MPFFATGARPPRTPLGRAIWKAATPLLQIGLRRGREELNEQRDAMGLAPVERFHGGISEELVLVATFPQLEYPRRWPPEVQVTGPMEFELPYPDIELPAGDAPLVLVAPSTAKDPEARAGADGAGGAGRGAGAGRGDDEPGAAGASRSRCPTTRCWSIGSATAR